MGSTFFRQSLQRCCPLPPICYPRVSNMGISLITRCKIGLRLGSALSRASIFEQLLCIYHSLVVRFELRACCFLLHWNETKSAVLSSGESRSDISAILATHSTA